MPQLALPGLSACVLLGLIASAQAQLYVVLCPSSPSTGPWGITPSACTNLARGSASDLAAPMPAYSEDKSVLKVNNVQWGTSTLFDPSGKPSPPAFTSLVVSYNGRLAPEVLSASFLGQRYPKAFVVQFASAQSPSEPPIAVWSLGSVGISSVQTQGSIDNRTPANTLSLEFDSLNYAVFDIDQTLYSKRSCFTLSTSTAKC